jgi:hypothetical protein
MFIHGCLRRKKEFIRKKTIQKAIKKVEKDMDLMEILNKVKEVDKIKDFLFDDHGRTLFEYFPKQVLMLYDPKVRKKISNRLNHTIERKSRISVWNLKFNPQFSLTQKMGFFKQLYEAYVEKSSSNQLKNPNNRRLINFLGEDLLEIFEKQKHEDFSINQEGLTNIIIDKEKSGKTLE